MPTAHFSISQWKQCWQPVANFDDLTWSTLSQGLRDEARSPRPDLGEVPRARELHSEKRQSWELKAMQQGGASYQEAVSLRLEITHLCSE